MKFATDLMFGAMRNHHISHLLLKFVLKFGGCPRLGYISPSAGAGLPWRKLRFTRHRLNDRLACQSDCDRVDGVVAMVCAWLAARLASFWGNKPLQDSFKAPVSTQSGCDRSC